MIKAFNQWLHWTLDGVTIRCT